MRKELYDRGVYVNPSLPPATAPDECLLRTCLMVTHTEEQIETAVAIINESTCQTAGAFAKETGSRPLSLLNTKFEQRYFAFVDYQLFSPVG